MTCKEIENRLPAYLENLLPPEENENIEGHLVACPRCSSACEALRKVMGLVQDLPEVEPPPFFEQRIMAASGKMPHKSGESSGNYSTRFTSDPHPGPRHDLVAVIAFSVYRTIMPELKDLAPPAVTAPEPAKDPAVSESRKTPESPASVTPVMKAPGKASDKKKAGICRVADCSWRESRAGGRIAVAAAGRAGVRGETRSTGCGIRERERPAVACRGVEQDAGPG